VNTLAERAEIEEDDGGGGRPGLPIDPLRLWYALRTRWQVIAVLTVVGAFAGAAVAKKVVKQSFQARAVMSWEAQGPIDLVTRQTTIDSVSLESNLEEVKKRMKLEVPTRDIGNFVWVEASPSTNIINITATWASGDGAADLANALMDVFLERRTALTNERINADVTRFKTALADAEHKQKAAADALDKFRRDNGINDIPQEIQALIEQAGKLAAQVDQAKATAKTARDEVERAGKDEPRGNAAPEQALPALDDLTDTQRQQAESDLKRLPSARSELEAARVQYSDEHPVVRRLMAEIDALETRIRQRGGIVNERVAGGRRRTNMAQVAAQAEQKQKAAEALQGQLQERLNKLSGAQGQAAVLMGEKSVAETALDAARAGLSAAELTAQRPPVEFRVLERAKPSEIAMSSPRKKVALGFPAVFLVMGTVGVLVWAMRKGDVLTPKEAAFWAGVPVIGASTWPRDPDMLASLMHDLDDFAPHCEGVTLIVGVSLEEAHLARRVAEWDGHRMPKTYDPQKLLSSGGDANALALRDESAGGVREDPNNMQILTLTGPVPAQALRRAARMADRVLVVVTSGKHSAFQLMKIKSRLGRDGGIGILLVGLQKEYAMVRDRVGRVESFWHATRLARSAEA
jgi:uncharacterized protein involved in exopolysaccharide biosynthesis